jgi:site-specific DNA recombinase
MSRDDSGNALNRVHRRKYLFSGLLKCGICGAGYTITGKDRYGCAAHRSKGICSNSRSVKRHDIEDRILSGLKDRLMAPELVASFTKEFTAEINRQTSDSEKERKNEERELATVTRKINAILEAIEDGMYTSSMKERMLALEDHKTKLQGALHTPPPSPLRIHPNIHKIYEQKVGELANTLNDDTVKAEASEIIRGLVDKVVLTPSKDDDQLHAQLHGDLATILELCDTDNTNKKRPSSIELGRQVSVVAGARNYLNLLLSVKNLSALN